MADLATECYSITKNQLVLQTYSNTQISWSWNVTINKFTRVFSISAD